MIFLIVGIVGIALGIALIVFRNAAAAHAERQMSKAISSEYRPAYAPWFIVVIGGGMVFIGGYFVTATLVSLLS
ncbi:hypothetical protein GA0004736_2152 [Curtobacterium sp. 9128]|uniref:hypothetical protein n=1 Tax=Curtobacterium sp. 9128 TaxID=1793722 RepID=UPI0007D7210B|nr:hypothetical protein [Curtobacterium sp. 9128]SBN63227.1 hypothetical protein GA0004736_2152 [Curtobacterium sp. 9128]